jgi:thioredoxin reductase (NADPH)
MDVLIVGDGPGGLSAALFLAKSGRQVVVFGQDETAMNWAMLYNYLGIEAVLGKDFQARARAQVQAKGVQLRSERVASLSLVSDGFQATLDTGEQVASRYVVLSEGKNPVLARALGCATDGAGIRVDHNGLTSVARVYAVGRMVRPTRSQAIISAGDGAKAALDILSRETGRDVQDWDTPPEGS